MISLLYGMFMASIFCISAYIIYRNGDESRYLLLRRCGKYLAGTWQMVTGGVHENEVAWQAALREIEEETGFEPSSLYTADAVETFYFPPLDRIIHAPAFVVYLSEMLTPRLSPNEHDEFSWLSFEEAKKRLVWSQQKKVISQVHENFVENDPQEHFLIYSK